MSGRLLAFLGRRIAGWPALLVLTARADELADAPGLASIFAELARDGLTRVDLGPLSRADTSALVRQLARAGQADLDRLEELAWTASEGYPFVVVETVRAHAEGAEGAPGRAAGLPERVRDIVGQRLDRLSEGARALATAAAVIGREFEFAVLHRAAGIGEAAAAEGVEELVRRSLFRQADEARLDFAHQFLREAVGGRTLPPIRRLLHGRVAAAIEELHAADLSAHHATLGLHHREAGRWDQAAHHLHASGRHAFAVGATRDAVSFLRSALDALGRQQPPANAGRRLDTALDLWAALFELGEFDELQELAGRVEAEARAEGDRPRLAQVLVRQAQAAWVGVGPTGSLEDALGQAREATALAADQDLRTRSYARFLAGAISRDRGMFAEAVEELEGGIALFASAQTAGDEAALSRPILVSLHAWRAEALATRGHFAGAAASAREACAVAESIDHAASQALAAAFAGLVEVLRGDVGAARIHLKRGLALAEGHDPGHALGYNQVFLAWALALAGEPERGAALLARAVETTARLRNPRLLITRDLVVGASVWLAAGRPAEARNDATRGLALVTESGARGHRVALLRLLAEVHEREGAADEAARLATEAMAGATALGLGPDLARCHLLLGRLAHRAGQSDPAAEHRASAAALLRGLGLPDPVADDTDTAARATG